MPKTLIIRFSSIGDIVLTSPVVRCVKNQLGGEVHFLTKRNFKDLVATNPYISKTYTIEDKVSEVLEALKKEQYDYIIDLHKNIRSKQVQLGLRAKYFTFDKLNLQKWLLVNWNINWMPDLHIVDRYMASVKTLGVSYDGQGLDYFIPQEDHVELDVFFKKNTSQNWQQGYIAFAIGAAHATKRLPEEKIIAICQKITKTIVLLGGPGDATAGEAIAKACGERVINTCGMLRLHQSASLVEQAQIVISHDTGLMHIAAAFKKPIISIWGNTVPDFGMYPFYPKGINPNTSIEVKDLSCRPCSKIGSTLCPKGHFRCMKDIEEEKILRAINDQE